jgi:uncharacterized membrane protein YhaH (DUF805 family)
MSKLIDDLLKENGKWSKKAFIMWFLVFLNSILGAFIVISDKILDKEINVYAFQVFSALLVFLTPLIIVSEVTKKFVNKDKKEDGNI